MLSAFSCDYCIYSYNYIYLIKSKLNTLISKRLITTFILSGALAVSAFGQQTNKVASQKALKQAFAGKFLIGCADDLRANSEAYQASIKKHYDIVTPENCMKPERIHPSENRYTFETADAMVDWCQKNGLKVWGHTLGWHGQTPPWFFQDSSNTATASAATQPAAATPQPGDTSRPRRNPPGFIPGPLAS